MSDIYNHFGDWYIRHNGQIINLNTQSTAELLIGLFEQVQVLEGQVHRRGRQKQSREKRDSAVDGGE
jgi:hypothetical protein